MVDILQVADVFRKKSARQMVYDILNRAETQAFIINLNTEQQLKRDNVDSQGVKLYTIGGEYSNYTFCLLYTSDAADE